MVNRLSCHIDESPKGTWTAKATATYLNHDAFQREPFKATLGVETGKNGEIKANRDCKRWMDAVRRAQEKLWQQKEKHK